MLWNDAAARLFGHSRGEAIGLLVEDLVPTSLKSRHRTGLSAFADTGEGPLLESGSTIEVPAVHRDGSYLWVEMSLTPLEASGLPGRYALAIVRDVTERRRLERQVSSFERALELTVGQLDERARQLGLLHAQSLLLQHAPTPDAAVDALARVMEQLWPMLSGAVYVRAEAAGILERRAQWGTAPPAESRIAADTCRALVEREPRRSRTGSGPGCRHVPVRAASLCVPVSLGDPGPGLLHLRSDRDDFVDSSVATLAALAANQVALATRRAP